MTTLGLRSPSPGYEMDFGVVESVNGHLSKNKLVAARKQKSKWRPISLRMLDDSLGPQKSESGL